jgi:hypothetical protein
MFRSPGQVRASATLLVAVVVAALICGCTEGQGGGPVGSSLKQPTTTTNTTDTLAAIADDLFVLQRGGYNAADFQSGWQGVASRLGTATPETNSTAAAVREIRQALRYDEAASEAWQGLIADEDVTGTTPARWIEAYPDLVLLLPDGFPSGMIGYEEVLDYCLARAAEHTVAAVKSLGGQPPDDSAAPLVRPSTGGVTAAVLAPLERRAGKQFSQDVWLWPETVRIKGAWAFANTYATSAGGLPMDWSGILWFGTGHRDNIVALLHKTGGEWKVVRYAWSPSDVVWEGWKDIEGVPKGLFN